MKYIIPVILNIFLHKTHSQDLELLILHNNDIHGRFEEIKDSIDGQPVGGMARTAHVIKEAREMAVSGKGPPVLYLNAGDTYTGTIWFSIHRWKIAVEFMNALKPDAACLGNHEFDDGILGLNPFVVNANFPIVTANIDFKNETTLAQNVKPYTVLNVNGRKIGIIGYLTPTTTVMATIGSLVFEDEIPALQRQCKNLEKEGVNTIIALGHSGYKMDKKIAEKVSCVDIVVGGHTNTFLWNGPQPDKEKPEGPYPTLVTQSSGKIVPVVQPYAYSKYIGKLNVVFDENGVLKTFKGQPIFLNKTIPQDPEILALLEKFRPAVNNYSHNVIGKSRTYLDAETCRIAECNFGNALADSFVDYISYMYKGPYWTNAPIGLVNGGSLRMSINASQNDDNITAGNILGAVPFDQELVTFDLYGADLIKSLELGVRSDGETSRGEFLQVSGLKVAYDLTKPPGGRVLAVKARCGECHVPTYSTIELDKIYRIVSTVFLLNGGDAHTAIKNGAKNIIREEINDARALQRYFEFYHTLTPQEEERITIISFSEKSSAISINHYVPYIMFLYVIQFIL